MQRVVVNKLNHQIAYEDEEGVSMVKWIVKKWMRELWRFAVMSMVVRGIRFHVWRGAEQIEWLVPVWLYSGWKYRFAGYLASCFQGNWSRFGSI